MSPITHPSGYVDIPQYVKRWQLTDQYFCTLQDLIDLTAFEKLHNMEFMEVCMRVIFESGSRAENDPAGIALPRRAYKYRGGTESARLLE